MMNAVVVQARRQLAFQAAEDISFRCFPIRHFVLVVCQAHLDGTFDAVATTYPEGVGPLLEEQVSYEYGELESEG